MAKATLSHDHSDIPEEIDFSDGERGKFYRENVRLRLPICPESSIQGALTTLDKESRDP